MTFRFPHPGNATVAIQRCGYARFVDPRTGDESFTRRLGTGFYPRWHLYAKETANDLILNLHLDQKKPSYGVGHAHSGEYEGQTVEDEARRIAAQFHSLPPRRFAESLLL